MGSLKSLNDKRHIHAHTYCLHMYILVSPLAQKFKFSKGNDHLEPSAPAEWDFGKNLPYISSHLSISDAQADPN